MSSEAFKFPMPALVKAAVLALIDEQGTPIPPYSGSPNDANGDDILVLSPSPNKSETPNVDWDNRIDNLLSPVAPIGLDSPVLQESTEEQHLEDAVAVAAKIENDVESSDEEEDDTFASMFPKTAAKETTSPKSSEKTSVVASKEEGEGEKKKTSPSLSVSAKPFVFNPSKYHYSLHPHDTFVST